MEEHRIYDLTSRKEFPEEEIGNLASKYVQLTKQNILVPQAFVLTTQAFDEFIQINGLIDFIIDALAEVSRNPNRIEKYSKLIQKEILKGEIDSNLSAAIASVYKRFSGFGKTAVKVQASMISNELEASIPNEQKSVESLFGVEPIIDSIKQVWASLFSTEAMKYREDIRYEGPLTMAVVVLKEPVAEVSGIVHLSMPLRHQDELEVEVILGSIKPLINGDLNGDSYICNLATNEVVERNIVEQKWMLVNKFEKGGFKLKKLGISNLWKNKAKLSDNQLGKIMAIANVIKAGYQAPVDLYLAIELGKIIITDIEVLPDTTNLIASRQEFSNFEELKAKLEYAPEPSIEIIPDNGRVEPIKDEGNVEVKDIKGLEEIVVADEPSVLENIVPAPQKSMDDYVLEVKNMLEIKPPKEQVDEPAAQLPAEDAKQKVVNDNEEVDNKKESVEQSLPKAVAQNKKIKTITEVYIYDFDKTGYEQNSTNIDGVIDIDKNTLFGAIDGDGEKVKKVAEVLTNFQENKIPVIYGLPSELSKLEPELEMIKSLRNKLGFRNLWVNITSIKREADFIERKKLIYLENLRRSSTFKVFAQIDNPASIMIVRDIIEAGVDGLVFHIDGLIESIFGDYENFDTKILNEYLKIAMKHASGSMLPVIVVSKDWTKFDMKKILKLGATGVSSQVDQVNVTKELLAEAESRKLGKLS